MSELAINGGAPIRDTPLPYGRQSIDETDIAAVVEVLRGDWLTTGPKVEEFESAFAESCGAKHAVAVSNGTAALHLAMSALNIGPGDEVIVPPITFLATANSVIYRGGTPIFADVDPETLLIDPARVEAAITPRTKAVIAVDYAGQPCDYDALRAVCEPRGIALVDDACHATGGALHGKPVGSLADLNTFSFHPVKSMTTGEGGAIVTDNEEHARRMRLLRNHGVSTDFRERERKGGFFYEMVELGHNFRLTDLQCALGLAQLRKLPAWVERRQAIAARFDSAFSDRPAVRPLAKRDGVSHGYHLYMIRLDLTKLSVGRAEIFKALRAENIGVNVHYIPVHLQPYYRETFGVGPGLCPVAETAYEELITLPIFPAMADADADDVIAAVNKVLGAYSRSQEA